jgi:1,4-dihydroxy-2-naphthoate octaprenyltransferase
MKLLKIIAEFFVISVKQFSLLFKILIAFSIVCALIIALIGIRIDPVYFWGLLILPPLIIISIRLHQKDNLRKLVSQLREDWGKEKIK